MAEKIAKLNSKPMLIISGVCIVASFITEYILPLVNISFEFPINPAWVSLIISGTPLVYSAIVNTLDKRITSPLLISIAMVAAVYIGDVFAAGEVAFIMAIGEWLEDKTVEKARKGIEKLINLVPAQGRLFENGKEKLVDAKNITIGDVLRVFPGESFAADGIVVEGNTTVDQSILTGESLPVDKNIGDEIFTGTINRFGSVDIKVTKAFTDSSLQKMINLVKQAEENKAPTQKIVDKWAAYLVPLAVLIAIVTYAVFAFGFGESEAALIRAVTVLVVFCPCALALATPTSIMAAIGQATKNGVLIKSGEALEQMGKVDIVALDKTGTITHGKLVLSDINSFEINESELLEIVCSLESRSEHPIGKAIVNYAKQSAIPIEKITDFAMVLGKGVKAKINGEEYFCGNEKLIESTDGLKITQEAKAIIEALRGEGKAVVIVASAQKILGVIGLSDEIRKTSKRAIELLKQAGVSQTVLLTGDNEKSAAFIAGKVGISEIHASLLPENKVEIIKKIIDENKNVCMVGDGVNDAPALKSANVGVAMAAMGSDIAIDAADIAILDDDITKISYIKKLSNATIFSIKFNITLSMIINFVAVLLSVLGLLNPATGALVHNAGSVFVVLNAARLYDKKLIDS